MSPLPSAPQILWMPAQRHLHLNSHSCKPIQFYFHHFALLSWVTPPREMEFCREHCKFSLPFLSWAEIEVTINVGMGFSVHWVSSTCCWGSLVPVPAPREPVLNEPQQPQLLPCSHPIQAKDLRPLPPICGCRAALAGTGHPRKSLRQARESSP